MTTLLNEEEGFVSSPALQPKQVPLTRRQLYEAFADDVIPYIEVANPQILFERFSEKLGF